MAQFECLGFQGLQGVKQMLESGRDGRYPGGISRARACREIITCDTRPVAVLCAHYGRTVEAWHIKSRLQNSRFLFGGAFFVLGQWLKRARVAVRADAEYSLCRLCI